MQRSGRFSTLLGGQYVFSRNTNLSKENEMKIKWCQEWIKEYQREIRKLQGRIKEFQTMMPMTRNERFKKLDRTIATVMAGKINGVMLIHEVLACAQQPLIGEVRIDMSCRAAFDVYCEDLDDEGMVRERIMRSIRDVRDQLNDILEEE